ncbi:MAG: DUF4399 domain-containing protein [Planctomycetota bacterium]
MSLVRSVLITAAALSALSACDSEATGDGGGGGHATSKPSSRPSAGAVMLVAEDAASVVWPANGTKVFEVFDLVVGLPGASVAGGIAVMPGGAPLAKGEAPADGAQMFAPGKNSGEVRLPTGSQKVCIQVVDGAGKSMGPDWANQVTYDVVAAPAERSVHFIEPADGATVKSPFKIKFGVKGMGMSPAGENATDHTVGHHHVLIGHGPMTPSMVVPADPTHIHYGKAQTETEFGEITKPGTYELTMQFADAGHRSFGPRMAATITVTVE